MRFAVRYPSPARNPLGRHHHAASLSGTVPSPSHPGWTHQPPPPPSSSLLAAGGIAVVIGTSMAGSPKNLISNPGFEQNLTGWTKLSAPQHLDRVAGGHSGGYAAKLWSRSRHRGPEGQAEHRQEHQGGDVYHVAAWVQTNTPFVDAVLRIREVAARTLVGAALRAGAAEDVELDEDRVRLHRGQDGDQLDFNVLARDLAVGHALLVDDAWLSDETPAADPSRRRRPRTRDPDPEAAAPLRPTPTPTPAPTPTRDADHPTSPVPQLDGTLFGTSIYQSPVRPSSRLTSAASRSSARCRSTGSSTRACPRRGRASPASGRPPSRSPSRPRRRTCSGAYDATP